MGIDVMMWVVLKNESDKEILNERIKTIHEPEALIMEQNIFGDQRELILGPISDPEGEYLNVFSVNTGLARYYGIGYERGPILRIITQIEWLRAQPEVIAVYYGGDTSDTPNEFTQADSIKLLFHFFKYGETPYRKSAIGRWSKI